VLSKRAYLQGKNHIMEHHYDNIQATVQHANKLRSDALGELLEAGWNKLAQLGKRLMQLLAPAGDVAETDIVVLGS
jgi:hypothetical protein